MLNEQLANDNIDRLLPLQDLIKDEYGNLYKVVGVHSEGDKITEMTLSNIYFEWAFSRFFPLDGDNKEFEEYKGKHIGVYLQDLVNNSIEQMKIKNRTIFSIRDLILNGTEVQFLDQTLRHPRSKPVR